MRVTLLLAFVAGTGLSFAAPAPAPAPRALDAPNSTLADCPGYTASNVVKTDSSLTADLSLNGSACNLFSDDLKDLKLLVEYQTDERLHVKIYDAELNVFQVQEQILPRPANENSSSSSAALQFDLVQSPFSFTVRRKENGEVLFDTSAAQLIFETQYVRLRTKLPKNPNLYGLGEHTDPFRLPIKNYTRTLYNSESPYIPVNSNLYGSHPVYFEHRGSNGTHGVFLLSSSAMNILIDQTATGDQFLEYNTIGGIIDLYFMAGKQPSDVSRQYAEIVGFSAMFPYWTFGFHQCKYGYKDVNTVAEVVGNYSTAGIPLEVMWTDIDYMNMRQDFTVDPDHFPLSKMRELVTTLHQRDQRYVLILDPGVHFVQGYGTYDRGHEKDVFLKNADGSEYLGVQWAGVTVWPDWFAPNTEEWWSNELQMAFNPETGINLDGIWVDMNEASNFCENINCNPQKKVVDDGIPPNNTFPIRNNTGRPIPGFPPDFQPTPPRAAAIKARNAKSIEPRQSTTGTMKGLPDRDWFEPKYQIHNHRGNLSDFTIYTNTTNYDGTRQYDTHNFYGHMMAMTTHTSMLNRRPSLRPMVLTRSTFAGSGRKVAHWFGDNASIWEHYRTTIRQMLSWVSMHQMALVGSDVCGFNGNTTEQLCSRWALLGAFQPFYRNHAEESTIQQEFYQWPSTIIAAKKAIDTRYKLLDYVYTALYYQTTTGAPMINPLWFLYPSDVNTFGIQEQWFYGDALLISPVTAESSDSVTVYLPKDTFYDYWTHERIDGTGANITISGLAWTDIPIHIRGGSIIPLRANSANTTKALRKEDFVILVAPDADGKATGRLYLDDGESIEQPNVSEINFTWEGGKFAASGSMAYRGASGESVTVAQVLVLGQSAAGKEGNFDSNTKSIEVDGPWKLSGDWGFQL
ncbi:glycoside hydrolase family 31 protein [Pleomassaria siparia CBS 279.74]|uniref:alpha-glucosidase n=1 Tax=Pleomassaria siparia CBS 279.74 TaxID=1314801 RepID=A0A6G1JV20_9PLEO|nr:glycoside hydrolase family 31 protein [Pleomassaria siparia CBS 279.74]